LNTYRKRMFLVYRRLRVLITFATTPLFYLYFFGSLIRPLYQRDRFTLNYS